MLQQRLFIFIVGFCGLCVADTSSGLNYRLSTDVLPSAYDVSIKPYLHTTDGNRRFTFDGEVAITLHSVSENIRAITLHKDYIEIAQAWLTSATGNTIETFDVTKLTYVEATDQLTLPLQNPLSVNANYTLHFKYTGQIRDGLAGFFRANYTDKEGNEKWIGVTQLQRIDARCAFPCFDEPAFKAAFRMNISRPKEYNAIFNTRLLNSQIDGVDRYMDHFDWTPVMSTYLVAFIVSDFVKRGTDEVSINIRPDYYDQTSFALEVAPKAVDMYGKQFGMTYKELGNPILQNAGSPKFPHNGMENWGLIIYRDDVLVHLPGYTDGWSDKEYTLTILVHEIAHMWFGNSVTFDWWSYFWLNEAFARYYQYFASHKLYPEYGLDVQFTVNQMHLIFGIDAVNTTQPMTTEAELVQTPSEIAKKFSSIAYAKGACIVRMLCNLMGTENFDTAIQEYLKENHLKTTKPEDLFVHLRRHWPNNANVDLTEFFEDWTAKVGFPMVTVDMPNNERTVVLTQKRFLLNTNDGSDRSLRYTIPITYTTSVERNFDDLRARFYFNRTSDTHAFKLDTSIDWIILNVQQSNYYRVFYTAPLLKNIAAALARFDHGGIHVNNRAQLIDDLFNFARVALMEYDEVFAFLEYLSYETEYTPWYATFNGLPRVVQRFTLEQLAYFRPFLFRVAEKVYLKVGVTANAANDTSILDVYKRNKVIMWLCKYGHSDCNQQAQTVFAEAMASGERPSTDYRETIYCAAVRQGDLSYYQHLDDLFQRENFVAEKEMLMRAMGCTALHMEHHYARILGDEIPSDYKEIALTTMYTKNPENVLPAFRKFTETLEELTKALGSWSATANVISGIADYFTTLEEQQLLEDLIAEKGELFGASVATLENAVKNVKLNLEWADQRLPNLMEYLKGGNGAPANQATFLMFLLISVMHFMLK